MQDKLRKLLWYHFQDGCSAEDVDDAIKDIEVAFADGGYSHNLYINKMGKWQPMSVMTDQPIDLDYILKSNAAIRLDDKFALDDYDKLIIDLKRWADQRAISIINDQYELSLTDLERLEYQNKVEVPVLRKSTLIKAFKGSKD